MAAFATAQQLADALQESSLNTNSANLALTRASAAIRNYTRQDFDHVTSDAVVLRGNWTTELWLPQRPVEAVSSVAIQWASIPAITVTPAMYLWDHSGLLTWAGGLASDVVANAPEILTGLGYWGGPHARINVTYDHGYSPIPDDVMDVCLSVAARLYVNPTSDESESDGALTARYSGRLTDDEKDELRNYRRGTRSPVST